MKGPVFQKGDNYKITKIHWQNLKIFFSRTTEPILTNLGTKHPWVRGIQVSSNEKNQWIIIKLIMFLSSLNQWNDKIICVYFLKWGMWPMSLLLIQKCSTSDIYGKYFFSVPSKQLWCRSSINKTFANGGIWSQNFTWIKYYFITWWNTIISGPLQCFRSFCNINIRDRTIEKTQL